VKDTSAFQKQSYIPAWGFLHNLYKILAKIVTKYRNGGGGERQADRKTNRENCR